MHAVFNVIYLFYASFHVFPFVAVAIQFPCMKSVKFIITESWDVSSEFWECLK